MSHLDAIVAGTVGAVPRHSRLPQATDGGLIVAEISFDAPATLADLAAIERSCTWCFETHRVKIVRSYMASNHSRAVLVFRAPDAESVRLACRHAPVVVDRVWACLPALRSDPP